MHRTLHSPPGILLQFSGSTLLKGEVRERGSERARERERASTRARASHIHSTPSSATHHPLIINVQFFFTGRTLAPPPPPPPPAPSPPPPLRSHSPTPSLNDGSLTRRSRLQAPPSSSPLHSLFLAASSRPVATHYSGPFVRFQILREEPTQRSGLV